MQEQNVSVLLERPQDSLNAEYQNMQFEQMIVFGHFAECQVGSPFVCTSYSIDKRHSPCIQASSRIWEFGGKVIFFL